MKPEIERAIDTLLEQEPEFTEGMREDIIIVAQKWLEVKAEIDRLLTQTARLTTPSIEAFEKLNSVQTELVQQRDRISKVYAEVFQSVLQGDIPSWLESALPLLAGLHKDFYQKLTEFDREARRITGESLREQDQLDWLTGYARRLWGWLRRTEKEITKIEQLVFYS